MTEKKRETGIYLVMMLMVAVFAIFFVCAMGYLNYRTSAIELEEQVIGRTESETVSEIETAIGFGKSFRNYYGMDEIFDAFSIQYPGPVPFVIDADGELLYYMQDDSSDAGDAIRSFLSSSEFRRDLENISDEEWTIVKSGRNKVLFTPVHQDGDVVGYFGALYTDSVFEASFKELSIRMILLALSVIVLAFAALIIFAMVIKGEKWQSTHHRKSDRNFERFLSIIIISGAIILLSALSIFIYQRDYRSRIRASVRTSMKTLEMKIDHVHKQGVDLRKTDNLEEYIEKRIRSMNVLHSIRITDHITEVNQTDEASDLIIFKLTNGDESSSNLCLEGEISDSAVDKEMRSLILLLASTMIILMIFVFELSHLIELLSERKISREKEQESSFSERRVSVILRFTGFLCSTAEYMCVPYAAMLIRASGESLFGLTVGMTAALPLTVEGFTQMAGMVVLSRLRKKFNARIILLFSAILMIGANITAFSVKGALAILLCRAAAGFAYAGFKQVSNFLITTGYETEEGRSENISQDNAGLIAGSTCGAGLGAILCANAGYSIPFLVSAGFFVIYLLLTLFLIPWKPLTARKAAITSGEPVQIRKVLKMAFSVEMLCFILVVAVPQYIGIMLCVTLIPAVCQINGISSIVLSYCYIANGLTGIYLGPALVSSAKKRFGMSPCIAFAFALTSVGVFILHVPPIVVMIVISSMILGFLDGFGTPMAIDQLMSLKVVRKTVDEYTALIFSFVLSYVLLTFSPVVSELLLLPGSGAFTPMLIGAAVYAAAAVIVLLAGRFRKAG